jgi:hypothetical protein
MKKVFDYLAAAVLIIPAGLLFSASAVNLWRFLFTVPHSSPMYFGFGTFTVGAPWSLLLQMIFACVAIACSFAIIRYEKKKLLSWFLGFTFLIVALFATTIAMVAKTQPVVTANAAKAAWLS